MNKLKNNNYDKFLGEVKIYVEKNYEIDKIVDRISKVKLEKTFSELLFCYIDEKKFTDVQTYKKANIDRRQFSKIKCKKKYRPKFNTIIKFGFALELSISELDSLLKTCSYTLSSSSIYDVIIKYFFENRIYNESLFNDVCEEFNINRLNNNDAYLH